MTSLSERYFRPKTIEFDGKPYEWLGVVQFKRLLMRFINVDPPRWAMNFYVLGGRSLEDVRVFEKRSRRREVIHLPALFCAPRGRVAGLVGARHRRLRRELPLLPPTAVQPDSCLSRAQPLGGSAGLAGVSTSLAVVHFLADGALSATLPRQAARRT